MIEREFFDNIILFSIIYQKIQKDPYQRYIMMGKALVELFVC